MACGHVLASVVVLALKVDLSDLKIVKKGSFPFCLRRSRPGNEGESAGTLRSSERGGDAKIVASGFRTHRLPKSAMT
jgi:hypothetical protein